MTESYDEADESFEYDEAAEAADEGEAMDEAGEAYDEAYDEMDEAADEYAADEAADEYAADEAADEGEAADEALDEAVDEAADESFDEAAMSASARLRANRDRNRRASWARRIAADQRLEAKRAASAQRSITGQIQGDPARGGRQGLVRRHAAGRRRGHRGPAERPPQPDAHHPDAGAGQGGQPSALGAARERAAPGDGHLEELAGDQGLAVTQASAVKRLTASQVKSDKDLGKRIVEGHNRLDERITKELGSGAGGTRQAWQAHDGDAAPSAAALDHEQRDHRQLAAVLGGVREEATTRSPPTT